MCAGEVGQDHGAGSDEARVKGSSRRIEAFDGPGIAEAGETVPHPTSEMVLVENDEGQFRDGVRAVKVPVGLFDRLPTGALVPVGSCDLGTGCVQPAGHEGRHGSMGKPDGVLYDLAGESDVSVPTVVFEQYIGPLCRHVGEERGVSAHRGGPGRELVGIVGGGQVAEVERLPSVE